MVMVKNNKSGTKRQSESGNVLFLILIAVALFAALSYAVTQSTRSGGGDASSETNLVNSSQITQYPAAIKTSITRMTISNSISIDTLNFDDPSLFTANLTTTALKSQAVFYPTGGGANYQEAPGNVMANNASGVWRFNGLNQVLNIGTDGADGNDIIAFLPGIKKSICDKINTQLGITGTIVESVTVLDAAANEMLSTKSSATNLPSAAGPIIGTGATGLKGKSQGCFSDSGSPVVYTYYSVLVER